MLKSSRKRPSDLQLPFLLAKKKKRHISLLLLYSFIDHEKHKRKQIEEKLSLNEQMVERNHKNQTRRRRRKCFRLVDTFITSIYCCTCTGEEEGGALRYFNYAGPDGNRNSVEVVRNARASPARRARTFGNTCVFVRLHKHTGQKKVGKQAVQKPELCRNIKTSRISIYPLFCLVSKVLKWLHRNRQVAPTRVYIHASVDHRGRRCAEVGFESSGKKNLPVAISPEHFQLIIWMKYR